MMHQAAAQYGPHPEPAHELARREAQQEDDKGHGQEGEARDQRRQAQHLLEVQRAHVPHREQRGTEQEHDDVGHLQRALVTSLKGTRGAVANRASTRPNSANRPAPTTIGTRRQETSSRSWPAVTIP